MEFFKKMWKNLREPSKICLVVFYILFCLILTSTILLLIFVPNDGVFHYIMYAISAITLTYFVYTIIYLYPKIKNSVSKRLHNNKYTNKMLEDKVLRTTIMAILGFIINVAYVLFQGIMGILTRSVWFITIACYYLVLIIIKVVVIFYAKKHKENELKQIKIYKYCGIMLNFLTFVLSGIIVLVNTTSNTFEYANMMILVVAMYTFYKIITSIIQMVKATKHDSLNIQCIRNLNFVNALYSILVLQIAMFHIFGSGTNKILNAVTGGVVAVMILAISIMMIIKSNKLLKEYKTKNEKTN